MQRNYLATHFNKKLTGEEVKKAVEQLLEAGLIAGMEAAVTYNFWLGGQGMTREAG